MQRREHWNLSKFAKLSVCQIIAMATCIVVILFDSPTSETLLQVNRERLFIYASIYGLSFLLAGEVSGLFVNSTRNLSWKRFLLAVVSSVLASLGLVLAVWIVEFDYIGRFAVLKIVIATGAISFLFLSFQNSLSNRNPWRVLALLNDVRVKQLKSYLGIRADEITWIVPKESPSESTMVKFCNENGVEILILDQGNEANLNIDLMEILASGVRVLGVEPFVESLSQKIPSAEVDRSWLARLDLRQRDPIVRRVKRLSDLFTATIGLILCLPILLIACLAIVLETGFPLFFHQKRTGLLGRTYTLHKLRTMQKDAEKKGAEWAQKGDLRVTRVGRFLRRWRIDEIPQFWNVIKGEMSIVGPRPERPELEKKINSRLPFWMCRYLLKPGLTGWAQIRFEYASDMESSEEKLAYDLFYIKNASFLLDLEIMLSTVRSLTKGSR
jgi:lipopolysaccharide/colanic/teichoic acid biosynthesis glycosyltransferase